MEFCFTPNFGFQSKPQSRMWVNHNSPSKYRFSMTLCTWNNKAGWNSRAWIHQIHLILKPSCQTDIDLPRVDWKRGRTRRGNERRITYMDFTFYFKIDTRAREIHHFEWKVLSTIHDMWIEIISLVIQTVSCPRGVFYTKVLRNLAGRCDPLRAILYLLN